MKIIGPYTGKAPLKKRACNLWEKGEKKREHLVLRKKNLSKYKNNSSSDLTEECQS